MTMPHGVLYDTQCATATLTALTPVLADEGQVKAIKDARLEGVVVYSPNAQYGTVHNSTSFGGTDPKVVVPGQLQTGSLREVFWNPSRQQLVEASTFVVQGYQDSGGNEDVNALLLYTYGRGKSIDPLKTKYSLVGRRTSKGGNLTADTWTQINTITDLDTDKSYAILNVLGYSANLRAIRFRHDSFEGLTPMAPGFTDVIYGTHKFQTCPVFKANSPLYIDGYTSNAEDVNVVLGLAEL
jgi:hypothetical protein